MLASLVSGLSGWKTYIIAALVLLIVVAEKGLGWDIPGAEIGNDWLDYVLGALGLSTVRAAITKSGP